MNVPGIVGMGAACALCLTEMDAERERVLRLRRKLEDGIMSQLDVVHVNGHPERRLPGVSNLSFGFVEGESLMMGMKGIAVSSGSACTSASLEPSYVLKAIGVGDELAHSSIRFGIGRFNTDEEIEYAVEQVVRAVSHLRDMSPLYDMHKEGIDVSQVKWAES